MSHNKTSHANWNQVVLTCSESIAMYNGGFWQKWNSQSCRSTFRVKKHDLLKWQPWIQTDTIDTQCYLHVYSLVQTGMVFVWQLRLGNGNQKYFTLTITPYLKQRLAILAEGPYTKKYSIQKEPRMLLVEFFSTIFYSKELGTINQAYTQPSTHFQSLCIALVSSVLPYWVSVKLTSKKQQILALLLFLKSAKQRQSNRPSYKV